MRYIFLIFSFSLAISAETMYGLINYAMKHSTVVNQTKADLEVSSLNRRESVSQKYGELNLVGNYTHYNTPRTLAPTVPSSTPNAKPVTTSKDIYSVGLKYSVPLFTGFAQTRQVEIANIAKTISKIKLKLTKEELAFNIKSLYLAILAQKEMLKAQRVYRGSLQRLVKKIAYEVKYGKKAEIDLLKAKNDVQEARAQEDALIANIETTLATLSALVGKDVKRISPLKIRVKKPRYSVSRLYSKTLTLSKVRIEDMALKKANRVIKKSESAKYPQVNFSLYGGKNYAKDRATNNWDDATLWQASLDLKYNLIDFGKRDIATQKAKVALLKAKLKRTQTLRDLKKSIKKAIAQIKESYAKYLSALSQYRLSKKAQEIEQARYDSGISTINDLLLAKAKTILARAKLIQNKYDYQKSKYYIDYIMERGVR